MILIIESSKSKDEVLQILQNNTSPQRIHLFSSSSNNKYFWGKITRDSFKIRRIICYQNSFLPIIVGKIDEMAHGTRIRITMRVHWFVMAFFIGMLYFIFSAVTPFINGNYMPFIILISFTLLVYIAYRIE